MERILIDTQCEIIVGRGIATSPAVVPPRENRRRVAILTQPGAEAIARELARNIHGLDVFLRVLPDRDDAKTLPVAAVTYGWLADLGFDRQDTIAGVGGGAVTDLAGFVAATYLRGVEAVYVPTTLLSAVDASVGGKTGVNLEGKNLVGAFWHPTRVSIDLDVLEALPVALRREGHAEALKAGAIADPQLFAAYETGETDPPLELVVPKAVAVKAAIVRRDPREQGDRALLNFGHTIGHAVEIAGGLSHGDAVAVGVIAAGRVSERLCGFRETSRLQRAIETLGLPTAVRGVSRESVLPLLGRDKKRDSIGLRMVLLKSIADPEVRYVAAADVDSGLRAIGVA